VGESEVRGHHRKEKTGEKVIGIPKGRGLGEDFGSAQDALR